MLICGATNQELVLPQFSVVEHQTLGGFMRWSIHKHTRVHMHTHSVPSKYLRNEWIKQSFNCPHQLQEVEQANKNSRKKCDLSLYLKAGSPGKNMFYRQVEEMQW